MRTGPESEDHLQRKVTALSTAGFEESTGAITFGEILIAEFSLLERRTLDQ